MAAQRLAAAELQIGQNSRFPYSAALGQTPGQPEIKGPAYGLAEGSCGTENEEENRMSDKLKVGILGGTGMVGQRFIALLENHPWFEVTAIAASPRSAGKSYEEAVGGRWKMDTPMPEAVKNLVVMNVNEVEKVAAGVDFVFSAVDMTKEEIKKIEEDYARTETPVVSNNSAHRWTPDVPMMVPEINPQHAKIIEAQRKRLGTTRGFVAVKPNCSIQSYAPVLTAWKEFEPYEVVATTYQED